MQRHHCHLLRKVAIDLKNDVFGGEWYDGESTHSGQMKIPGKPRALVINRICRNDEHELLEI